MRDLLLNSENDIDTNINTEDFFYKPLEEDGFEHEELLFAVRYLRRKGYLRSKDGDVMGIVSITIDGYDNWLFPQGAVASTRIFLSHAIEDKDFAGKLKNALENYSVTVFLAHEDIPATEEWRDKLIAELHSSSLFISLRTEVYNGKSYTEQECGFALALKKRILTIFVGTPDSTAGFCSAIQGKRFKNIEEFDAIVRYCVKQFSLKMKTE